MSSAIMAKFGGKKKKKKEEATRDKDGRDFWITDGATVGTFPSVVQPC